ncbi:hypothetical protein [Methylosinus sp. Sm6]|uniref:hypothetical protein n=1 Tax=Methylosinus sp. Sm6 TaxID=2866948 RepID=UPI001C9A2282|nr:hypothetical protein [Methylosinus sp. Sm6]MBY6241181.1 hypothetical protein [Methylosinus sp. Sm6]
MNSVSASLHYAEQGALSLAMISQKQWLFCIILVAFLILNCIYILNARLAGRKCEADAKKVYHVFFMTSNNLFLNIAAESSRYGISENDMRIIARYSVFALYESIGAGLIMVPIAGFIINCGIFGQC